MSDIETIPDKSVLAEIYSKNRPSYEEVLSKTVREVSKLLQKKGIHPTIKSRIKDFDSYFSKKIKLLKIAWDSHTKPLPVNDMLAMRIICPFLKDLDEVESTIRQQYEVIEIERKGQDRSFREFGYESIHVLIRIPEDILPLCQGLERNVIEIQLRTILQEAWAEVEHELVYKAEFSPFDEPLKRKLAALNAMLTLSDIIFQEILDYQKKLNEALKKRREDFYGKVEAASSEVFGISEPSEEKGALFRKRKADTHTSNLQSARPAQQYIDENLDLDTLLLAALNAHNASDFENAISIYTEILSRKPENAIAAVVYKHRGMAFFAQSKYSEAQEDFTNCIALDSECYKAMYYRGVVKSLQGELQPAIDDFTMALEIHPYHFFSRYRRALCWLQLGDSVQAHADCEIALRIDPGNRLAQELEKRINEKIAKEDI